MKAIVIFNIKFALTVAVVFPLSFPVFALAGLEATARAEGPVIELGGATEPPAPTVSQPVSSPSSPASSPPSSSPPSSPPWQGATIGGSAIGGYGELTLNAPGTGPAIVDLRRFVLYVGHNFTDRLRFSSEIEVEHAVSSADDQGEVEIEQAYLDGLFTRRFNLRGGLILMPVGIINLYHEPTTFNGVDRPDVDLLVIPSTWREPGIGLFGELATGLNYQLYVVNGLNANGFSAGAGLADGHQEAQLAAARDFGVVGRLAYEPRLGTALGLSGYFATAGNSLRPTVGQVPVGLVEVDARTRLGGFSARAELAFAFVGDAGNLDRALAAGSTEQMAAGAVASRMQGGYLEAAYDLLRFLPNPTDQSLTLFARFDHANTQARLPAGFAADRSRVRYTTTAGLSYRPIPNIALKADYRRHEFGAGPGFNELASAITWMF